MTDTSRDVPGARLLTPAEIERRFRYHPATTPERREAHERVRAASKELAYALNDLVPATRDAALAFTKLEEVMMWANAALARTPDVAADAEDSAE